MDDRWTRIRQEAVLYEDDAVLVVNKPAGLAVMGERHDTDLVRLAAAAGEQLYPAHRIDKVTSGALLLARQLRYHGDLTRQFSRRSVAKAYLAITRSSGLPERGTIDLPLSVGRKNRVRVAANRAAIAFDQAGSRWHVPDGEVFGHVRVYPSLTTFLRVWGDERHTLLVVCPVTGRRHQIRAHLAWIGHPIEGDPLFGPAGEGRTLLHSWRLSFTAPWAGERPRESTGRGDDWPEERQAPPRAEGRSEGGHGEVGGWTEERQASLRAAERRGKEPPPRSPEASGTGTASAGAARETTAAKKLLRRAGEQRIEVEAPPGPDFWAPLRTGAPVPLPDGAAVRAALPAG